MAKAYHPFADLLKRSRKKLNLTQSEVCDILKQRGLNTTQRTISSWENGLQLPAPDNLRQLEILADVLNIDPKRLYYTYDRQNSKGYSPQALSVSDYLDTAQQLIDEVGPVNMEIWFFGIESVLIHLKKNAGAFWTKNLKLGCSYNIVWLLDQMNTREFLDTSIKIEAFSKKISTVSDSQETNVCITNYPIVINEEMSDLETSSVKQSYRKLCSSKSLSNWIPYQDTEAKNQRNVVHNILKYLHHDSSLILYAPKTNYTASKAVLGLKDFYLDTDGNDGVSPFVWYNSENSERIRLIAKAIESGM